MVDPWRQPNGLAEFLMRRFGQLLALLGLALGGLAGLSVFLPIHLAGLSWLVAVGMIKLTFVSALGLIAGGAVLQRIANRDAEQKQLERK